MDAIKIEANKTKTARWLFYIALFQFSVYFAIPAIQFPAGYIIYLEILSMLTVGVIFAAFFLAVNIYCLINDKQRKPLYVSMISLMCAWLLWTIITWTHIEHMDYLLH